MFMKEEYGTSNIDYDMLNYILDCSFCDYYFRYYYKNLRHTIKLCEIIMDKYDNTMEISHPSTTSYFSLNDSIKIINDFLYSINEDYSSRFLNILYEKNKDDDTKKPTVEFSYEEGINKVQYNGKVSIFLKNSISDSFSILHEMTHKFSLPYDQYNMIMSLYAELPTILMEFIYADYLKENHIVSEEEINEKLITRFKTSYESAVAIMFEKDMIDLYKKKRSINYINLGELALKYKRLYNYNVNNVIMNILDDCTLSFPYEQRYVVGLLGAVDLYDKINEDNNSIDDLFTIIEELGNSDFERSNTIKALHKIDSCLYKKIKTKKLINLKNRQLSAISHSFDMNYKSKIL